VFADYPIQIAHLLEDYPKRKKNQHQECWIVTTDQSNGILYKAPQENYAELLSLLSDTPIHVISIEGAQGNLDLSVLSNAGEKRIMLGVLDVGDNRVETVDDLIRRGYEAILYLNPGQLILAPDCGMLQLERRNAFKKLRNLSTAAKILNQELGL